MKSRRSILESSHPESFSACPSVTEPISFFWSGKKAGQNWAKRGSLEPGANTATHPSSPCGMSSVAPYTTRRHCTVTNSLSCSEDSSLSLSKALAFWLLFFALFPRGKSKNRPMDLWNCLFGKLKWPQATFYRVTFVKTFNFVISSQCECGTFLYFCRFICHFCHFILFLCSNFYFFFIVAILCLLSPSTCLEMLWHSNFPNEDKLRIIILSVLFACL